MGAADQRRTPSRYPRRWATKFVLHEGRIPGRALGVFQSWPEANRPDKQQCHHSRQPLSISLVKARLALAWLRTDTRLQGGQL